MIDAEFPPHLVVDRRGQRLDVQADCVILATGSRELFLPFPGWTLPGVLGVGGAQALSKTGVSFRDRRVVIAGSGPVTVASGCCIGPRRRSTDHGCRAGVSTIGHGVRPGLVAPTFQAPGGRASTSRLREVDLPNGRLGGEGSGR